MTYANTGQEEVPSASTFFSTNWLKSGGTFLRGQAYILSSAPTSLLLDSVIVVIVIDHVRSHTDFMEGSG